MGALTAATCPGRGAAHAAAFAAAGLLADAGAAKLVRPGGTVAAVRALLPKRLRSGTGATGRDVAWVRALGSVELLAAAGLAAATPRWQRGAAVGTVLLGAGLTGAANEARRAHRPCGCRPESTTRPARWVDVGRAGALTVAALAVARHPAVSAPPIIRAGGGAGVLAVAAIAMRRAIRPPSPATLRRWQKLDRASAQLVQRAERSTEAGLVADHLGGRGAGFEWSKAIVAVTDDGWSVTVPTDSPALHAPAALVRGDPSGVTVILRWEDEVLVATKGQLNAFPVPATAAGPTMHDR